jgi:hypothetical protein
MLPKRLDFPTVGMPMQISWEDTIDFLPKVSKLSKQEGNFSRESRELWEETRREREKREGNWQ